MSEPHFSSSAGSVEGLLYSLEKGLLTNADKQEIAKLLRGAAQGKPVAFVPVHPRHGPLWSDTFPAGSEVHRSNSYPTQPLYDTAQPPAAPVETAPTTVWRPIDTAPKGPTISVARKGGQRDDGSTYWYQAVGHYDPNLGHFHEHYGELYGEPEVWAHYPENPERCAAQPPAAPVETDSPAWHGVQDAIDAWAQKTLGEDAGVIMSWSDRLAQHLAPVDVSDAREDVLEAQGTIEQLEKQLAYERKKYDPNSPGHTDLMLTPESIDAFLEASPPPHECSPAGCEPVAWRVKNDFGHWYVTQDKALADTYRDVEKKDVQPLYLAAQPPAAPVQAEKATADDLRAVYDAFRASDPDAKWMSPTACMIRATLNRYDVVPKGAAQTPEAFNTGEVK